MSGEFNTLAFYLNFVSNFCNVLTSYILLMLFCIIRRIRINMLVLAQKFCLVSSISIYLMTYLLCKFLLTSL